MPQAAFADSTTAPEHHPWLSLSTPVIRDGELVLETDFDAFTESMDELSSFLHMLDAYLQRSGESEDASGVTSILRRIACDLRETHSTVRRDLDRSRLMVAQQQGKVTVYMDLLLRLVPLVADAWRDAGRSLPFGAPDEWPEPFRSDVVKVAEDYAHMVMDRVQDRNDAIEAGSYLPWISGVIRKELVTPVQTEARPVTIRDQFIMDCVRKGEAVGDIAQALGLSSAAVDRALRRLRPNLSQTSQTGAA